MSGRGLPRPLGKGWESSWAMNARWGWGWGGPIGPQGTCSYTVLTQTDTSKFSNERFSPVMRTAQRHTSTVSRHDGRSCSRSISGCFGADSSTALAPNANLGGPAEGPQARSGGLHPSPKPCTPGVYV